MRRAKFGRADSLAFRAKRSILGLFWLTKNGKVTTIVVTRPAVSDPENRPLKIGHVESTTYSRRVPFRCARRHPYAGVLMRCPAF
jgi:hypothetical protein